MKEKLDPRLTWAAAAAALVLGVGVGRFFVAEASHTPAPGAQATPGTQDAMPSGKVEEAGITRYQVPVTITQPAKGPKDALVTIVEWCDFQSVACRAVDPIIEQMLSAYPGKVRRVFRHLAPPSLEGQLAHEFAQLVHDRADKFWLVRERLLKRTEPVDLKVVEQLAREVELDWQATFASIETHAFAQHVGSDALFGKFFGATSAPSIFVNGRRLGEPTAAAFRTLIDDELKRADALVKSGVAREEVYANLIKGGRWTRPPELDAPAN